jgi:hypothetical protein
MPIAGVMGTSNIKFEATKAWTRYIRQLLADNVNIEVVKIGGPNIIIDVDVKKLGKRKYYRVHSADGEWVVARVELTAEKKYF